MTVRFTDDQMRESHAKHAQNSVDPDSLFYAVCLDVLGYTPLGHFIRDMSEFDAFEERYKQLFESAPDQTSVAAAVMDYSLANEVMAALLVRGVQPIVEPGEEEIILRFDGCDLYFSVDDSAVSFNERIAFGGSILIADWTFDGCNLPTFAAGVVNESWAQIVAECGSARTEG